MFSLVKLAQENVATPGDALPPPTLEAPDTLRGSQPGAAPASDTLQPAATSGLGVWPPRRPNCSNKTCTHVRRASLPWTVFPAVWTREPLPVSRTRLMTAGAGSAGRGGAGRRGRASTPPADLSAPRSRQLPRTCWRVGNY